MTCTHLACRCYTSRKYSRSRPCNICMIECVAKLAAKLRSRIYSGVARSTAFDRSERARRTRMSVCGLLTRRDSLGHVGVSAGLIEIFGKHWGRERLERLPSQTLIGCAANSPVHHLFQAMVYHNGTEGLVLTGVSRSRRQLRSLDCHVSVRVSGRWR